MAATMWSDRGLRWNASDKADGKLRARWRPIEIAAMVAGFVLFWPVGLAVLGWKLNWFGAGDWIDARLGTNRLAGGVRAGCGKRGPGRDEGLGRDSGNTAFEAWKDGELARLEAEYEALSQRQREFEAFLQHLREAKDREEFERFMQDRKAGNAPDAPAS